MTSMRPTTSRPPTAGLPDFSGQRRARRARPGFAMMIMMVVIALLAVFIVVAARLTTNVLNIYREAGRVETDARSVDAALALLRQDVWAANDVRPSASPDGRRGLTIDRGSAPPVAWTVEQDGTLARAEINAQPDRAPQRWRDIGQRLHFEFDGLALTVLGADNGADRAGGVRMVSQVKLAQTGGG